jgi:flagellar hook protein FlgE
VKTATPNQWQSRYYIDGTAVGGANAMTYSNLGVLTVPAGGTITLPAYTPTTGAAPIALTTDVLSSTQYGSTFGVNQLNQDGFASGRLSNIDVDSTGVIFARFTNGRSNPLGQVALSNFANTQGLRQLGNTSWGDTFTSGDAVRGSPGTGSFGLIQSGAL